MFELLGVPPQALLTPTMAVPPFPVEENFPRTVGGRARRRTHMPALSSARRAAAVARSEVSSPSAAMWRWRMPVRAAIHSSLVSTIFDRSSLVSTLSGR